MYKDLKQIYRCRQRKPYNYLLCIFAYMIYTSEDVVDNNLEPYYSAGLKALDPKFPTNLLIARPLSKSSYHAW